MVTLASQLSHEMYTDVTRLSFLSASTTYYSFASEINLLEKQRRDSVYTSSSGEHEDSTTETAPITIKHYHQLQRALEDQSRPGCANTNSYGQEILENLSGLIFQELVTDVCDEVVYRGYQEGTLSHSECLRLLSSTSYRIPFPPSPVACVTDQEGGRTSTPDFLAVPYDRHPQRDNARQKLADLPPGDLKDLVFDVCHEFDRRFPHFTELKTTSRHSPNLVHSISLSRIATTQSTHDAVLVDSARSPISEQRNRCTSIVSSKMSITKIISVLGRHDCPNITGTLETSRCTLAPVAGGGFSDVYQGHLRNGDEVAIKCLRLFIKEDEAGCLHLKAAAREIHAWSKYHHPNIVELLGLAQFQGRIAMISPWMTNGTLNEYIRHFPKVNRCRLCREITEGVAYLHVVGTVWGFNFLPVCYVAERFGPPPQVHGDIKAANVLVSRNGTAKLADFGNTRLRNGTLVFTGPQTASRLSTRWTAPEQLTGNDEYSLEADIYALGMTMLEAISGDVPFSNIKNDPAVIARVAIQRQVPDRPQRFIPSASKHGDNLWELLTQCWAYDPQSRPKIIYIKDQMAKVTRKGLCIAPP